MERWLLSFITGAILSLFSPVVPALFYETLLIVLIIIVLLLAKRERANPSIFYCCIALIGAVWMFQHGASYNDIWQNNQLVKKGNEKAFFYQKHESVFSIIDIPTYKQEAWRFTAKVTQLNNKTLAEPFNIRLTVASNPVTFNNYTFKQGDTVSAKLKLKPAHGFANSGGFNYKRWLRSQNIVASAYISNKVPITILSSEPSIRAKLFHDFKSSIDKHLGESHSLMPLVEALTFGERINFNQNIRQILQQTGTQHLVAISGLHIGLVASIGFVVLSCMFRLLPLSWLPFNRQSHQVQAKLMRFNARAGTYVVMLMGCIFYAYLADFSIPTIRALIMLSVFVVAKLFAIHLSFYRLILVTIALIVVLLPSSLYSESFWLSVIAVVLIALFVWRYKAYFVGISGMKKAIVSLIAIQAFLSIAMIPISAVVFGKLSFVSFAANIVALPVVSFIVLPVLFISLLMLLFSETLSALLTELALTVMHWLWRYLSWLSELDIGGIGLSSTTSSKLTTYLLVSLLMMVLLALLFGRLNLFKGKRTRGFLSSRHKTFATPLSIGLLIIGLTGFTWPSTGQNKRWQVTALDVGQGLAIVIEKNGRAILYDTGAAYPSGFSAAESSILPYLAYQGIIDIDYVIVSHDDNDHAGGLSWILASFSHTQLIANLEKKHWQTISGSVKESVKAPILCAPENSFTWQGLSIAILSPTNGLGDKNDDSCVIKITDGISSVLLPGDISSKIERRLVNKQADLQTNLQAEILIAPHHGSKTSSSAALIHAVKPQVTIFSAGFYNRWRMPNHSVIARYQAYGSQIYNTAVNGMVKVKLNEKGYQIDNYRQDISPFWFC